MALFALIRVNGEDVEVTVVESSRKPTKKQAEDYYELDYEGFDDRDDVTVEKVTVLPEAKFKEYVKIRRGNKESSW